MSESLPSSDPGTQKRRSTRIVQAIPITVSGVDALGQPFKERTTTVTVNCHGCKYQSKHYVPKNSSVTLEIPRQEPSLPARTVTGHVVWVQRPRTVRELFQIGLEFELAGNVWGISFPPDDWFPCPEDQGSAIPEAPAMPEVRPSATQHVAPVSGPVAAQKPLETGLPTAPPPVKPAAPPVSSEISTATAATEIAARPTPLVPSAPAAPSGETKIHVMPSPAQSQEAQLAVARQMAKIVAEAKETLDKTVRRSAQTAVNEEMTIVRQQLDSQLHETIEHAIKASMERVSEAEVKKVVQQAATRTAAIVDEARKANEAVAAQLDIKIHQAVQQAVQHAADQAAREAAQQAASHNLKQAVEQVVERVLAEREATSPSLKILSSPEAAQRQLDEWKKNIEETARSVHGQVVEQSQAEGEAAKRRWREELEAMLAGSAQNLGDALQQASQQAMAKAESDIAERSASFRAMLHDLISGAQSSIQGLGAELAQERAQAEQSKVQLGEAAGSVLEQTRRQLDQILSAQGQTIGEKADQIIAQRVQAMEPALQDSAQKTMERVSGELDQKLATKIEEAQRTASELANARQQAYDVQNSLRETVQQSSAQLEDFHNTIRERVQQESDAALQQTRSELAKAGEELARLQNGIREASEQAGQAKNGMLEQIHAASSDAVQRAISQISEAERHASQFQDSIRQQLQQTSEHMAQMQSAIREQAQQISQQVIEESLDRLRQETSKYPAEFERSCRAVLSKLEEEIEQKSGEMQHATYDALLKASEWYQKKAQTTMQSALERVVEQSTSVLRDRASEISSRVASELDHYRRTYVEHGKAEMEEVTSAVVELERGKLNERAEIASAAFTDRVQHLTNESIRQFEEASRAALGAAHAEVEHNRDAWLAEFQKKLDERMTQGVEQAGTYLQSQLVPLLEIWESKREAEKRIWLEQLKKSSEESIEQYKIRLENATNSWLLASAATLGQNSQAVLDSLAQTAEKRLRDTCSRVLAGMGDTLKQSLLGISNDLSIGEEDMPSRNG